MSKISKISALMLGFIIYYCQKLISTKDNLIIFGGGNGQFYSENSKYLFEYYLKHSNNECWWVTRNYSIYKRLKQSDIPVLFNYSPLALLKIVRAAKVVFCTSRSDVLFVYKSNNKFIINLFHGMPLKKIIYDYDGQDLKRGHLFDRLWNKYVAGFRWEDLDVILSTSEYFNSVLISAFRNDNIVVTGLPRNDYFFEQIAVSSLFSNYVTSKKIISYLPTHRKFGFSNQAETPFINDVEFQKYLKKLNTLLVHKPHYNVNQKTFNKSDTIVEFGPGEVDVQEILKYSDILITDYSSCYIDFLLLDRPIIFYRYDNYIKEDTGLYEKIEKLTKSIGPICETESQLKQAIKEVLSGNDRYYKSRAEIKEIFHENTKSGFSKSAFELIESEIR